MSEVKASSARGQKVMYRVSITIKHLFRGKAYAFGTCLLCVLGGLSLVYGQESNTYVLDSDFDTGDVFKSTFAVTEIEEDAEARIIAVGSFDPISGPFKGSGRVFENGTADLSWYEYASYFLSGIEPYFGNRYLVITSQSGHLEDMTYDGELMFGEPFDDPDYEPNFRLEYSYNEQFDSDFVTSFKVLPNNKVLMCGEYLADSLHPERRQHLVRVMPDGSHDPAFPLVECDPNAGYVYSNRVMPGIDDKWYLSGRFEGVNGHYSPNLVRLNADFTVDTTFTSPFISPYTVPNIGGGLLGHIEESGKLWYLSYLSRLESQPDEPFYICRLLTDGSLDTTFSIPELRKDTALNSEFLTEATSVGGIKQIDDKYLIYGRFAFYNDTLRKSIAMIDENGHLVSGYFETLGADSGSYGDDMRHPRIADVLELDDGRLVVSGVFSHFGGEQHYNMARLKPGTIGFEETEKDSPIRVFPNPAVDRVWVRWSSTEKLEELRIYNSTGKRIASIRLPAQKGQTEVDLSGFSPGLYFMRTIVAGQNPGVVKLVVQ